MTDSNNRNTLKEAFDAELMKRLEENPPEIPTYEEFSAMVDKSLAERCRRRKRIAGIAAGFVVVLLTGILACTNLTADVDADKNPKEEIITEDGVIIEDGGWGSSEGEDNVWSTTNWEYVKLAEKSYTWLKVPEYIPAEYAFSKLKIEVTETEARTAEYIFYDNSNKKIEIEIFDVPGGSFSNSVNEANRTIRSSKGNIYINDDKKIATIQGDNGMLISIWYNLNDEEIVKIVENIS